MGTDCIRNFASAPSNMLLPELLNSYGRKQLSFNLKDFIGEAKRCHSNKSDHLQNTVKVLLLSL